MNIDSASPGSLLPSVDGLDRTQQTIPTEITASVAFSDTLMNKIKQLKGLGEELPLTENLAVNNLEDTDILHGVAGLFGNNLPMMAKVEKDIDLEDTLEALENVMKTLEQADLTEEGVGDLEIASQLSALVVSLDKTSQPAKVTIQEEMARVKKEKVLDSTVKAEQDNLLLDEKVLDSAVKTEPNNLFLEEEVLGDEAKAESDSLLQQENTFRTVAEQDDFLLKQTALDNELETEKNGLLQQENTFRSIAESDNILPEDSDLDSAAKTEPDILLHQENAFRKPEQNTFVVEEKVLGRAIKTESDIFLQQENAFRKSEQNTPLVDEKVLSNASKTESETLLQQENLFRKPVGQDNSFVTAKQTESTVIPELKDLELTTDKSEQKIASNISMLNRAVISESGKAEIPPMTKHFANPEWNKEIGERVIWMHKQAIPSAELRLNPGHLGPITIKVDVTQDQATVAFTAQHGAVKEAIEAAIPKLREMFSAQQLNLTEVNVSQDNSNQRQASAFAQMGGEKGKGKQEEGGQNLGNEQESLSIDIANEIEAGRAIASNGVLSLFA